MDEHSSPSVPTKVWVTLGLLAYSWLILSGLFVRDMLLSRNGQGDVEVLDAVLLMFFSGPHLLFALSAWHGRDHRGLVILCLLFAVIYAIISLGILSIFVLGGGGFGVFCFIMAVYFIGWLVGSHSVLFAFILEDNRIPPSDTPSDP